MASAYVSNKLLDEIDAQNLNWTGLDVRALLLDNTQSTDRTNSFVTDLSGELTDSSYSRVTVTNRTSTLDTAQTPPKRVLTADDVTFPSLSGTSPDRMVLFVQVTDDTDSWIIGYYQVRRDGNTITLSGDDLVVPPDGTNGFLAYGDTTTI